MKSKIILLVLGILFVFFSMAYVYFSESITGQVVMHSAVSNGTELYVDAAPTDWGCTVRTASSTSAQGSITQAVSCSGNEKVISGGCYDYNKDATFFLADYPTDQEWYCVSYYSGSHTITANANCCT